MKHGLMKQTTPIIVLMGLVTYWSRGESLEGAKRIAEEITEALRETSGIVATVRRMPESSEKEDDWGVVALGAGGGCFRIVVNEHDRELLFGMLASHSVAELWLDCSDTLDLDTLRGLRIGRLCISASKGHSGKEDVVLSRSLESFSWTGCWTNLSAVARCPNLAELEISHSGSIAPNCSVSLEPLRNCRKLVRLRLSGTFGPDFSPLSVLPLEECVLTRFESLPDLGFLAGMSTLRRLSLWKSGVSDLSPLKGLRIEQLDLSETKVRDLSPLRGMPLTSLDLSETKVDDLSPLRGMPLTRLDIYGTAVSDLSPLQGMRLRQLNLFHTKVRDLSPLRGMLFESLDLSGCETDDLSPLADCPRLKFLTVDPSAIKRGIDELKRRHPDLDLSDSVSKRPHNFHYHP